MPTAGLQRAFEAATGRGRLTQGFDVIRWMEACCVHTEGQWRRKPFRLLPWQKRLLLELFTLEEDPDWVSAHPDEVPSFRNGLRRRYRQAFICIPKKNGKTELAAAIALYLLLGDGEPSPKGVFVAGSLKQAGVSFRSVQTMILESPVLRQVVGERNVGDQVIEVPSIPGSRLERVAAEAGTNDGPSLSEGVLDEVHEYKGEPGRKVYGVITNAGAARDNPLFVAISTVGLDEEDEDQVWVDLYRRGKATLVDPDADRSFYFFLAQAPEGSDWQDRAVWEGANPSANFTVSWSFYQSEWAKGEPWCRRYYLNQPPGRSESTWMPDGLWDEVGPRDDLVAELTGTARTYAVARLANDHQTAAVAVAQRQGENVVLLVRLFPAAGSTDDEYQVDEEVEAFLRELHVSYPAKVMTTRRGRDGSRESAYAAAGPEVGYHGSFFERSAQLLRDEGLVTLDIPDSPERRSAAAETLLELVASGHLVHDGSPELARQIANVDAKPGDKGPRITTPSNPRKQITGALAAMFAVHRAMTAPDPARLTKPATFLSF